MKHVLWLSTIILFSLPYALLAQDTRPFRHPSARNSVKVLRAEPVVMRDGKTLSADVYLPRGTKEKLPTILIRTPYDKASWDWLPESTERMFAGQGYAVVIQDVRGRYESQGVFSLSAHERLDGLDTLAWIVAQPWSDGKVGT